MTEKNDPIIAELLWMETPPISHVLKKRTLALARTNLLPLPSKKRSFFFFLVDYSPPAPLVPSLLALAAVIFVIDAVTLMASVVGGL
jgi:hypothetical protein